MEAKPISPKIDRLVNRSKEVLRDSALENGAIIAGNSDKSYYPKEAKDYHYVWPRDAAFICVAAGQWGITDIQEPFFVWLTERPEDFKKEGLLFANYTSNGRIRVRQFQPDQAGSILWAIKEFYADRPSQSSQHEPLIRRLADGLADDWKGRYFFHNTVDLWEEGHRMTSTRIENNHTYSLAACVAGLRAADALLGVPRWRQAADEMTERIMAAYSTKLGRFIRTHGRIEDSNVDASLLGLVWPFDVLPADDPRMAATVRAIEEKLVVDGGVHRYEHDYYDGEGTAQEGGGAWPLLNFWLSMYWSCRSDSGRAQQYYRWVVDRVGDDDLIPEQLFDDFRQGIKPLAWSHAMFLLATRFLNHTQST